MLSTLPPGKRLEVLRDMGVSEPLMKLIKSYLQERKIFTEGGETILINSEVPQCSLLTALLWIIRYDGVLRLPVPKNVELVGYADDLAILASDKDIDQLQRTANETIQLVER